MAKRGYLKSKTIHHSPTDGKICLTASIISCKGFFSQVPSVYLQGYTKTVNQHFMKFGQDMEPVLRKKLIKTVVDLDYLKEKEEATSHYLWQNFLSLSNSAVFLICLCNQMYFALVL